MQVQISLTFDTLPEMQAWLREASLTDAPPVPAGLPSDVSQQAQAQVGTDASLKAQRQQQAANARAAKASKTAQADNKPTRVSGGVQSPPVDVAGTNGAGDQSDDDLGLTEPSMSPGEAKDQALALMREAYAAGHVKEVKELQKKFNVAKFYDVPVDQGHSFYQQAMQLVQGVGLRQ